jgi:hypothetical protein
VGLGAALETGNAVIHYLSLKVHIIGKLSLLASNGKSLQEVCGTFLMEYGKAGEGLLKVMFVNVGDVGTLGFDQLKSLITKPFVVMDQSTEVCIHFGRY